MGDREVVVAVVDSGIDYTHPDLADNIWLNPGEIPNNGVDDDRNGYKDDIRRYNFYGDNPNVRAGSGHGTHCAGIIGAIGNNEFGVAGVNWKVTILPIKAFADGSSETDIIIEALAYARRVGVQVYSLSFSGPERVASRALREMFSKIERDGSVVVAAAGNSGSNLEFSKRYPASYPFANIISVGANDPEDRLASFSNFGPESVDIVAPGGRIYSTGPNRQVIKSSGTSMSAPHVAGAAALLLSLEPNLSGLQVKERIMSTADRVPELLGRIKSAGRLNLTNMVFDLRSEMPELVPLDFTVKNVSLESPHPYLKHETLDFEISQPGAKSIMVHFKKLHVLTQRDWVSVYDKEGNFIIDLTDRYEDFWLPIKLKGDKVRLVLRSSYSNKYFGFAIDKIAYR